MPTGEEYLEKTMKVLQSAGAKVTVTVTKGKKPLAKDLPEVEASNQLSQIAVGWANVLFKDKVVEHLAEERMEVCKTCPAFNEADNKCSKTKTVRHINGTTVNGCGCPLDAKVRSPKSFCPAGKWNPVDIAQYKLKMIQSGLL